MIPPADLTNAVSAKFVLCLGGLILVALILVVIRDVRNRIQWNRLIRGKSVVRVTQTGGVVSWVTSREPTPIPTLGPREEAAIFHDRYEAALIMSPITSRQLESVTGARVEQVD